MEELRLVRGRAPGDRLVGESQELNLHLLQSPGCSPSAPVLPAEGPKRDVCGFAVGLAVQLVWARPVYRMGAPKNGKPAGTGWGLQAAEAPDLSFRSAAQDEEMASQQVP